MARRIRRNTGQPSRPITGKGGYPTSADEILMALGSAERKARNLADKPSEFAPPGGNPYRVNTMAPPVDAPKAKMARGRNRRPLI